MKTFKPTVETTRVGNFQTKWLPILSMYTCFLLKVCTYFIPTLKLKTLRPLPLKSLLLLRNCKFVVVLNGCFCYFDHMCTCLFWKYNVKYWHGNKISYLWDWDSHCIKLSPQYCMIQISWGRSPVYSMILFGK